jgi:hypothetical protein
LTHQQMGRVRLYTCPWSEPQSIWDKGALHSHTQLLFLLTPFFSASYLSRSATQPSRPLQFLSTAALFFMRLNSLMRLTCSSQNLSSQLISSSSNHNPFTSGRITLPGHLIVLRSRCFLKFR